MPTTVQPRTAIDKPDLSRTDAHDDATCVRVEHQPPVI
jgi:hypothetical protein